MPTGHRIPHTCLAQTFSCGIPKGEGLRQQTVDLGATNRERQWRNQKSAIWNLKGVMVQILEKARVCEVE